MKCITCSQEIPDASTTCPYCNNMVDKKDKECPYCLKSLSRWNTSWSYVKDTWNNSINPDNENHNTMNDTIRDDKQKKTDWEMLPIFQKLLDFQKQVNWWIDTEAIKKIRKYIIIFFLIPRGLSFIISIIESIIWK